MDYTIFVLLLPAILISLWAQLQVKTTYAKYAKVGNARGLTAAQVARMILDENGLQQVPVGQVAGHLSDHFNPRTNVVNLSNSVYASTSVAAIGVAAHECGHAIQYAKHYFPMKVRSAIIPVCNIGSYLTTPLLIFGLIFSLPSLIWAGIILFSTAVLFQLITLPVEFNASRRAMAIISDHNILMAEEQKGARRTLTAAAMTYVAALLVSLMQLLRLILLFGGRRRN